MLRLRVHNLRYAGIMHTGMRSIIPNGMTLCIPSSISHALEALGERQAKAIRSSISKSRSTTCRPVGGLLQYSARHPFPPTCGLASRPSLVGCEATRDLLVRALTQETGNLWPPARNLRRSELILDRGIPHGIKWWMLGGQIPDIELPILGVLREEVVANLKVPFGTARTVRTIPDEAIGGGEEQAATREVEQDWSWAAEPWPS